MKKRIKRKKGVKKGRGKQMSIEGKYMKVKEGYDYKENAKN